MRLYGWVVKRSKGSGRCGQSLVGLPATRALGPFHFHHLAELPKVEQDGATASNACPSGCLNGTFLHLSSMHPVSPVATAGQQQECVGWLGGSRVPTVDFCTLWAPLLSAGILHITSVHQVDVITYHGRA